MRTVLLTWELGRGFGHLAKLRAAAVEMLRRGWRVCAAVCDEAAGQKILAPLGIGILAAPSSHSAISIQPDNPLLSYAHMLKAVGWGEPDNLMGKLCGWDSIFNQVEPDLVICDHSPTALLAMRGHQGKRATWGEGFFIPPNETPWRSLRYWRTVDYAKLERDEEGVLSTANLALEARGQRRLSRLAELYASVDESFLTTVPELDHFARGRAQYWGAWPFLPGASPEWPAGSGERIFAYLRPCAALKALLAQLRELNQPTLVYLSGADSDIRPRFASSRLRFVDQLLDLRRVGDECSYSISMAAVGTVFATLLCGKPNLMLPIHVEQVLLAAAVARSGLGVPAPPNDPEAVVNGLKMLMSQPHFSHNAAAFKAKYAWLDERTHVEAIADRVAELLGEPSAAIPPALNRHLPFVYQSPVPSEPGPRSAPPPPDVAARHLAALHLQADSQVREAVECLSGVVQEDSENAAAWNDLGCIQWKCGDLLAAEQAMRQAVIVDGTFAAAHNNLGCVLQAQQSGSEAEAAFRRALAICPNYSEAYDNLGCVLRGTGRLIEATLAHRRAIEINPWAAGAHSNLGCALDELGNHEEAVICFRNALRLDSRHPKIHQNLAAALQRLGQPEEALDHYNHVLRINPEDAEAHFGRATLWLAEGDFARGFREYDWRWKLADRPPHDFGKPLWDGSPLAGRRLLVHIEQGLGDTLQFVRYLPRLACMPGTVLLGIQKVLAPLLIQSGFGPLIVRGPSMPDFDVHVPLLSIPAILGTTLDSIPADVPYLSASPQRIDHWRTKLEKLPGLRVGIHWQGNPMYSLDRFRSIPLTEFRSLAEAHDVILVSLQHGRTRQQVRDSGAPFPLVDLGGDVDQASGAFMDTAAIMMNLDLIITSDSAIAHLAGALGLPVWLVLSSWPDWRWMRTRIDNPWYPTMQLFRQSPGETWSPVFERVKHALCAMVEENRGSCPSGSNGKHPCSALSGNQDAASAGTKPSPIDRPYSARSLHQAGIASHRRGDLTAAINNLEQSVAAAPNDAMILNDLGCAQMAAGNLDSALVSYTRAIDVRPEFVAARCNLGFVLRRLGRDTEAVQVLRAALEVNPRSAEAHNNLACTFRGLGNTDEAERHWRLAIESDRNHAESHCNLATLWHAQGRTMEALDHHERAVRLKPREPEFHNSLACALYREGRYKEALIAFDRGLDVAPQHSELNFNRSLVYLVLGQWDQGWHEYEWRLKSRLNPFVPPDLPLWNEEMSLTGRILVIAEQGLGDTLQFIRYVPCLQRLIQDLVLQVAPALVPLLSLNLPGIDVIPFGAPPDADAYVPLLSLPRVFRSTVENVPAHIPYLAADSQLTSEWAEHLGFSGSLKVGFHWQGNASYPDDARRSIPLKQFDRLAEVPNITWVCLQKDASLLSLRRSVPNLPLVKLGRDIDVDHGAFMDTAAIATNLDLVISSDTAMAHLAGALGIPTWLAIPRVADWRWLLDRTDSPWYPSMRLFRQSIADDWTKVFSEMATHLGEFAGNRHKVTDCRARRDNLSALASPNI